MSDDIHIPTPSPIGGRGPVAASYRARRAGPEPGMRAIVLGALALGGVLLAGGGGWALMSRRPAGVPVIEADGRPLRIKPENAGGMQVAGADEMVMGGEGVGSERMAPSAETPAPQALLAQMQQAGTLPAQQLPAVEAPAAVPASPPAAMPVAPAPIAAAAPPVASRSPAVVRPAPAGGMMVQLAALETEGAAQAEWQRLAKRMPELLGDRRPTIQKAERDGHAIWRVRTGGFADVAEATGFCSRLRAKGGNCTLASF